MSSPDLTRDLREYLARLDERGEATTSADRVLAAARARVLRRRSRLGLRSWPAGVALWLQRRRVMTLVSAAATAGILAGVLLGALAGHLHGSPDRTGAQAPRSAHSAALPPVPSASPSPSSSPATTSPPGAMVPPSRSATASPSTTPVPSCPPSDFSAQVELDRSTYDTKQPVTVYATITNTSSHNCQGFFYFAAQVTDPSGKQEAICPVIEGDVMPGPAPISTPGQTNAENCTWLGGTEPGFYSVTWYWFVVPPITRNFEVTALPTPTPSPTPTPTPLLPKP